VAPSLQDALGRLHVRNALARGSQGASRRLVEGFREVVAVERVVTDEVQVDCRIVYESLKELPHQRQVERPGVRLRKFRAKDEVASSGYINHRLAQGVIHGDHRMSEARHRTVGVHVASEHLSEDNPRVLNGVMGVDFHISDSANLCCEPP
jgi:hypothetical protein